MTPSQEDPGTSLEPYKTSDTPFAAFLHFCGYKIVGTIQDPNDHKREVVVFVKDDFIDGLSGTWRTGKAEGNLRDYQRSLKIVNRTIFENRKTREN